MNDYRSIVSALTPYFSLHLHKLNGLPMFCVENGLFMAYYKGDIEATFKYLNLKDLDQADREKLIAVIEKYCALQERIDDFMQGQIAKLNSYK